MFIYIIPFLNIMTIFNKQLKIVFNLTFSFILCFNLSDLELPHFLLHGLKYFNMLFNSHDLTLFFEEISYFTLKDV